MDPHKRSATIEVIDEREQVRFQGRYGTDTDGYQQMLAAGRRFRKPGGGQVYPAMANTAHRPPR
jgi:hypothetical protein